MREAGFLKALYRISKYISDPDCYLKIFPDGSGSVRDSNDKRIFDFDNLVELQEKTEEYIK